jgi:thiol:disulfide interchange protein DsbD
MNSSWHKRRQLVITRWGRLLVLLGLWISAFTTETWAESPFGVTARVEHRNQSPLIRVDFSIPPKHILYADQLKIATQEGLPLEKIEFPPPVQKKDPFSDETKKVYDRSFTALLRPGADKETVRLVVKFQGCDETVCFFPETRMFDLSLKGDSTDSSSVASATAEAAPSAMKEDWTSIVQRFEVRGQAAGYLGQDDFLAFLDRAEGRPAAAAESRAKAWVRLFQDNPVEFMNQFGWGWTVLLIVVGGLLLNLTPCVLPMIPINLAVIGAGVQASSRKRGFLLGGVYGLAIALVYGILGLVVVLSGSQFGALNSSPWFNLVITIVFVLLALAMFDIITIDFTRLQGMVSSGRERLKKGSVWVALIMGSLSALLAGACVAPVVISVLVLASNLYGQGWQAGLALPFLLGLGMALPWPFAGAGLSFLPKPGQWMVWVKYGFGIFILLLALYYGSLAFRGFKPSAREAVSKENVRAVDLNQPGEVRLSDVLLQAEKEGRPVFIDFWATWCKNCEVMEKTTFQREAVVSRLDKYLVIKAQAERPSESPAQEVLNHFGVKGLPTYIILQPHSITDH